MRRNPAKEGDIRAPAVPSFSLLSSPLMCAVVVIANLPKVYLS